MRADSLWTDAAENLQLDQVGLGLELCEPGHLQDYDVLTADVGLVKLAAWVTEQRLRR